MLNILITKSGRIIHYQVVALTANVGWLGNYNKGFFLVDPRCLLIWQRMAADL